MKPEHKWLAIIIIVGTIIRALMIFSTPALFEWDETFHALVAKNMIEHPFKPMLRVNPILPFDYTAWCCNHIWLHKQPLFLWQMALSMKVLGVSVWAMRLPSLIMGVIMIPLVYFIGINWTKSKQVALLAAALSCFHVYQLGMISGRFMLDHNDLAFTFYMTCAIWGLSSYTKRQSLKKAVLIGLFIGCAILIKWLTALLVFGGWGLYLLLERKINRETLIQFAIAILISVAISLPWQLYIMHEFPKEASYTYQYNVMHMNESLGHDGDNWFHIEKVFMLYGYVGIIFIIPGLIWLLKLSKNRSFTYAVFAMIGVIYFFFSIFVKAKMPAFTMPVSSLVFVIIASGLLWLLNRTPRLRSIIIPLVLVSFMQPWIFINKYLNPSEEEKNRIYNTKVYQSLPDSLSSYAIFNLKPYQEIDLMFHKDFNAFTWYPTEQVVKELLADGNKIAIFRSHTNQKVPAYMVRDDILMIDKQLR